MTETEAEGRGTAEKRFANYKTTMAADNRNPSEVYDDYWIFQEGPSPFSDDNAYGKWLVFDHISKIDNTWKQIRDAVASGQLHAVGAKVATAKPNELAYNPNIKVICIYSAQQTVDEVGLLLIKLPCIRRTIRYKTDEATLSGHYVSHGFKKVTSRTLEWNNGSPTFKQ